jgi:chaperonin GroEL (HSP60 family)
MAVKMLSRGNARTKTVNKELERELESALKRYRSAKNSGHGAAAVSLAKEIRGLRAVLDSNPRVSVSKRSAKTGLFDR